MFVVAKQAEQAITSFSQVNRYQLVVGRRQHRDEIVIKIELKNAEADTAKLTEGINKKFQETCRIKADKIEFVEAGSIPEDKQGIVDERKWE
jgi:phenylacetate-coenzyme A ligase PaaK-like adenylate-forming protein